MNRMDPDLLIRGRRVLTMDPSPPLAESVAVKDDRIVWVGADAEAAAITSKRTRMLDYDDCVVLPGFHDAHFHLLAYATSLGAVDCRPRAVSSIPELGAAISKRATVTPAGHWVRGTGYDDVYLHERRHPTRWDLDAAAPDHPVRIDHRSGHASVLNSRAMVAVGLRFDTPEPPSATIERSLESGEPNGVLFEMHDFLDDRLPRPSKSELTDSVRQASGILASKGITAIQDATASNSTDRWDAFRSFKAAGALRQRATVMPGVHRLSSFTDRGLHYGSGDDALAIGAAKTMLTMSSGRLSPDVETLRELVVDAQSQGFQVAIHAVEAEAVAAAAAAISAANTSKGSPELRHRIEHCSELPPDVLAAVVASGAVCVVQPGFVFESGDRYLAQADPEMLSSLYRVASLARAGAHVAFGSDSPVADPDPLLGVYGAVTRLSLQGAEVGLHEAVSVADALRFAITGSAYTAQREAELGMLAPGMLADMVVLDQDPLEVASEDIRRIRPEATIIGGQVVWES